MASIVLMDTHYAGNVAQRLKSLHFEQVTDFQFAIEYFNHHFANPNEFPVATELRGIYIWFLQNVWLKPNAKLLAQLKTIKNYYHEAGIYINGQYLLENPNKYTVLNAKETDALDRDQLEHLGKQAFQNTVVNEIQKEVAVLQKLNPEEMSKKITIAKKKQERIQKMQQRIKRSSAPQMGDEAYTGTQSLVEYCGGLHNFQLLIEKIQAYEGVINAREQNGLLALTYKDTHGVEWDIEMQELEEVLPLYYFFIKNKSKIHLETQEAKFDFEPAEQATCVGDDSWKLGHSSHLLKIDTIVDLLMTQLKGALDFFILAQMADKLDRAKGFAEMSESLVVNTPVREDLIDTILDIPSNKDFEDFAEKLKQAGIMMEVEELDIDDLTDPEFLRMIDRRGSNSENSQAQGPRSPYMQKLFGILASDESSQSSDYDAQDELSQGESVHTLLLRSRPTSPSNTPKPADSEDEDLTGKLKAKQ